MRRRSRRSSEEILEKQKPKAPQGEEEGRTKGARDQQANVNFQMSKTGEQQCLATGGTLPPPYAAADLKTMVVILAAVRGEMSSAQPRTFTHHFR